MTPISLAERDGTGFGMSVQPLTREQARQLELDATSGVLVTDVQSSGRAADAGLRRGDVITEVDGKHVDSVDTLRSLLKTGNRPALLLVHRERHDALPHARSRRAVDVASRSNWRCPPGLKSRLHIGCVLEMWGRNFSSGRGPQRSPLRRSVGLRAPGRFAIHAGSRRPGRTRSEMRRARTWT